MIRGIGSSLALVAFAVLSGCHFAGKDTAIVAAPIPRELEKINLPDYRVEPPDILMIEAVRMVPRPPFIIEPLDVLFVQLANPFPNEPLEGAHSVEPDGTLNLGATYGGVVTVAGMTLVQARDAIEKHLVAAARVKDPKVVVSLAQSRVGQRIGGPHMVRPDGTVSLGSYGGVRVSGMTLPEVKAAIEGHLSGMFQNPEIAVDVQGYNSKLFYVILDGGGTGQQVVRLPITGNETVLDAIAQVNGLAPVSSKNRVWVSRPAPAGACHQVLPVDWKAISECGDTASNYQLLPGDRVFVGAQKLVVLDTALARLISPFERLLGVVLLGTTTTQTFTGGSGVGAGIIIP